MQPTDKTTTTGTATGNGHADSKRRLQAGAHDTVDRAARGVHDTVDRLADVADRTTETLGERTEQLNETKERVVAQARSYVQMHPVASLGIAVAAGFLLSALLRSNSH